MSLTQEEPTRDLRLRLTKLLRGLLEPVKVKRLVITHSDKYTVRGIVLTECPIERTESGRDFEVGLGENDQSSIQYVSVDGRRIRLKESKGEGIKTPA